MSVITTLVESTTLWKISYEADRAVMLIEFRDRSCYRYEGVPTEVHDQLRNAPSKGAYFNQAIRGRYAYQRISAFVGEISLS